jgi:phosphoserine phosphatase
MSHVLVLISNPADPAVSGAVARVAARAAGTADGEVRWLAEGIACELDAPPGAAAKVREVLGDTPVDIALLPTAHRRKQLLVADMDSTIIEQECIDEMAEVLRLRAHIAAITERAMRGELEFADALRERVALLEGIGKSALHEIAAKLTLTPGARALVRTMRAAGGYCALVSGGFTLFTEQVAGRAGFNENRANELLFKGGVLSGAVREPVLGAEAKVAALRQLQAERGLDRRATMAVGDGANDLAMIAAAGLGVAFRAKPIVAEAADVRIDHGDLTALLYLQGYREDEFVGD